MNFLSIKILVSKKVEDDLSAVPKLFCTPVFDNKPHYSAPGGSNLSLSPSQRGPEGVGGGEKRAGRCGERR